MTKNSTLAVWQFTPTKWHTVADKEKFAKHYIRFVQARCPFAKFHDWFYKRLMQMFMHIAHYNRFGFYETWCDSPEKRFEFVRYHAAFEGFGEPAWTWCDVEQTLRTWLNESGIVHEYEIEGAAARRVKILALAKATLGELRDDEIYHLLQERNTLSSNNGVANEPTQAQSSLRGKQQLLFQI